MTMTRRATLLLFGLLLLGIYAVELTVVHSARFAEAPRLGPLAVTIDLTVIVPLLYWYLAVRRGRMPWASALAVFMLSVTGAAMVLPAGEQQYLRLARLLAVPAELVVLVAAGRAAARAVRAGRAAAVREAGATDPLVQLRQVLRASLWAPAVADVVAYEAALIYYALLSWRARPDDGGGLRAFTYHARTSLGTVWLALAGACAVETVVVHLWLQRWSVRAAWLLTALSVYGILWLVGFYRAARLRPMLLDARTLHLRIGLQYAAEIPLRDIVAVAPARFNHPALAGGEYLALIKLGDPQLILELAHPVRIESMYGLRKSARFLGLTLDEPEAFRAELTRLMAAPR